MSQNSSASSIRALFLEADLEAESNTNLYEVPNEDKYLITRQTWTEKCHDSIDHDSAPGKNE